MAPAPKNKRRCILALLLLAFAFLPMVTPSAASAPPVWNIEHLTPPTAFSSRAIAVSGPGIANAMQDSSSLPTYVERRIDTTWTRDSHSIPIRGSYTALQADSSDNLYIGGVGGAGPTVG